MSGVSKEKKKGVLRKEGERREESLRGETTGQEGRRREEYKEQAREDVQDNYRLLQLLLATCCIEPMLQHSNSKINPPLVPPEPARENGVENVEGIMSGPGAAQGQAQAAQDLMAATDSQRGPKLCIECQYCDRNTTVLECRRCHYRVCARHKSRRYPDQCIYCAQMGPIDSTQALTSPNESSQR